MKSLRGYVYILCGTIFWGTSAVIAKLFFSVNAAVDPLILVQTRVSLSFMVMFLIFLMFKRQALRLEPKDFHRIVLMGVFGIAGSNFTYYYAIEQINVSTAILLQYTAPLLVLSYATLTKEESLSSVKVVAAFLSILGCFFAVGGAGMSFTHISGVGLVAGIGAAVCWAFTNVYLRHLLRSYTVWTVLVYSFLAASIFWLLINPPWEVAAKGYSTETWLQFLGFAMISVLIPHSLYFTGVRYVAASRAIITGTFEPIVAITGSFIVLGEELTLMQIAGATVVIAAISLLQLKREEGEVIASPAGDRSSS